MNHQWFDDLGEKLTRKVAHSSSRRSVLAKMGKLLVGSAFIMPVLPVARGAAAQPKSPNTDPMDPNNPTDEDLSTCEYWRYCGVDGFLCHCCGGTDSSCPPGSDFSQVAWVGTCHNPADGKDYMVSYHDCCGKTACGRCSCATQYQERPGYEFFRHNDVNWCMGDRNLVYHCTVSRILGLAKN